MENDVCPYCKEKIKANAIICKHCHSNLYHSKKEMTLSAIARRMGTSHTIQIPSFSPCKALCYAKFGKLPNKKLLNECLDNCKAIEAEAMMAERLVKVLYDNILDIIWNGGNIDPKPIEKMIQDYFSKLRNKI